MQLHWQTILVFFIWPDAIPNVAVFFIITLFPLAIFRPVIGTLQIAGILFVLIWSYRRWRRKRKQDGRSMWNLLAWIVGGYIVAVTATNLLAFVAIEWAGRL